MDNENLESIEKEMDSQRKRMYNEYEIQMKIENRYNRNWSNYFKTITQHSELILKYRELLNDDGEK